jgi:hypothetical protein
MSVSKWKIYCQEEQQWTEGWSVESPIKCFNNNLHEVNLNSIQELESTHLLRVKIEEESIETGGHYTVEGHCMTIQPNAVTTYDISWPFPVSVTVVNIQSKAENVGDTLSSIVGYKTICGVVTSNIGVGQTQISVTSTVIVNVKIGFEIYIGSEFLGRIVAIDAPNFFITMETPTTIYHPIGSPVYTQVRAIRNYQLGMYSGNELGVSNIGGKYLKTGTLTKIFYTNNSNEEKKFRFSIEYLF